MHSLHQPFLPHGELNVVLGISSPSMQLGAGSWGRVGIESPALPAGQVLSTAQMKQCCSELMEDALLGVSLLLWQGISPALEVGPACCLPFCLP